MADYYTQAVLESAPLKDVPDIVFELLLSLSTRETEEARALLDGIEGDKLISSLKEYGILVDREGSEDYEWAEDSVDAAAEMTFARHKDGDDQDGVYVHWEESLGDGAGPILQWLLAQLPEEVKFLRVGAANTASKPLTDAYGGFCIVVARDNVWWLHASAAADRIERVLNGEVDTVAGVWREFNLDDDGLGSPVARKLAAFIESSGLDGELRRFLKENAASDDGMLTLTTLVLYQGEPSKILTIKAVRELLNCGLKEAKELVESMPASLGDIPDEHPVVRRMKEAGAQFTRRPKVARG